MELEKWNRAGCAANGCVQEMLFFKQVAGEESLSCVMTRNLSRICERIQLQDDDRSRVREGNIAVRHRTRRIASR